MSDFYKYDDFDYTYIDPKTGVLKNLLNITDILSNLILELITKHKANEA